MWDSISTRGSLPHRFFRWGRWSDSDGLYAYDLPSGRYTFEPDLPPGTQLSWFIGSDRPLAPFDLIDGVCQERDIEVFPSGSIQGRVLDSRNKPLAQALVYIVPADRKVLPKERQLYWESQGKEGFFKFVHVPPGEYVILVNPDDAKKPNFPYPRTFYPGVHERDSAAIITIRGGEHVHDADIPVGQQFAPRHITVKVTWSDGRLIRDFVFVEATPTNNRTALADTKQPDRKSSVVELLLVPNEPYKITAELTCLYEDARSSGPGATLHSDQVQIEPKDERKQIALTIPGTSCPEISGKTRLTER